MKLEGDRGHLYSIAAMYKKIRMQSYVWRCCPCVLKGCRYLSIRQCVAMLKRVCMCVHVLCSSPQDSDNRMHMYVLACEVQYIRPYLCSFVPLRIHYDSTLPSKLPSVARYDCGRHFS